ncbi:MAG: hypothetical protein CMG00_05815 [Candidatus Marinimicrobia bacterium]|nr:hypothetical protein [Candidatus Neomarinimicrobiota bacterium]
MILYAIFLFTLIFTQEYYDGYLIYTPGGGGGQGVSGSTTYLRSGDGLDIIKSWSHSSGPASMPYLFRTDQPGLENSLLYYPSRSNQTVMDSGGVGGQISIYDWNGTLLWNYVIAGRLNEITNNNRFQHHHDIEPLPNGNILVIAWEELYQSEWSNFGFSTIQNGIVWSTAILELKPNLETGQTEIVWEWYIKDHLVQNVNPSLDNYAENISDHPELMNPNINTIGGGFGGGSDWMHINAIDYNEDLDQIILSSRFMDEIYIIDHSTTTEEAASHSGGNSNKGGDFLYRWGKPENYGRGNESNHLLGDQHSINWIDKNIENGGGNLICYVNQLPTNPSRAAVVEFIPPLMDDGNYYIEDGEPWGPNDYEWIVTATGQNPNFTSSMQGGAFRLPNGNTLISDCDSATIYETDEDGNFIQNSANQDYLYRINAQNAMIARAQKYSPDYFEGEAGILGDLNDDGNINVADIILVVNVILGLTQYNSLADMNDDGNINVQDIILIVNIILFNN